MNYILGIDEAGRGPVLGPLVVAGVLINETNEHFYFKLGVKDSKKLSFKKREYFSKVIFDEAKFIGFSISWPNIIDEHVQTNSLNILEAKMMSQIINSISRDKTQIIIDSPQKNFLGVLSNYTQNISNIKCEFKADDNYIAVSLASIVAKYTRDSLINELKLEIGDFGSGYTSDAKTIKFLKENKTFLGDIVRKSWKTYKNL